MKAEDDNSDGGLEGRDSDSIALSKVDAVTSTVRHCLSLLNTVAVVQVSRYLNLKPTYSQNSDAINKGSLATNSSRAEHPSKI